MVVDVAVVVVVLGTVVLEDDVVVDDDVVVVSTVVPRMHPNGKSVKLVQEVGGVNEPPW